jgi:thioredoxin-like negative regulator of GroEL
MPGTGLARFRTMSQSTDALGSSGASSALTVTRAGALDALIQGRTPLLACFANPRSHEGREAQALLEEVGAEFGETLTVAVVDARRTALARKHGVTELPVFLLFSDGRERLRLEGTVGPAALRSHLQFALAQQTS